MKDSNKNINHDVRLGKGVKVYSFVNLYGCSIGNFSKVGTFVEIQKDVTIGEYCKISSHTFICSGVKIGNSCFIGHGVMFINDNHPKSVNENNELEKEDDWLHRYVKTIIGNNVSIGSNATILGDINIGDDVTIGAGSVVTKNIESNTIVAGNPARIIRSKN